VNELLRFPDLAQYGVRNWPTLKRWIKEKDAPAGFYLGSNTRAWLKKDWDNWLANRPQAGAPPPEKAKPGPKGATSGTGPTAEKHTHPLDSDSAAARPAPLNGRG
jgi:predicted DNA-binding transcriptional regulator AlpA